MSWLVDPYESLFMRNAAAAAVIVGVLAPAVGTWIVLRGLAYLGDALSHATLGGVAAAYVSGFSLVLGALGAGLVMGALLSVLGGRARLRLDAVIGVVETIMFALGVVLIARSPRGVDLTHFLFGQITTVTRGDVAVNAALAAAALAAVALLFRDLRASTFDPVHAAQVGVRVGVMRFALLALLSVAIVVSLSTVGVLMSVALLVTPAATARLLTNRLTTMTAAAVALGVSATLSGLTLSYHLSSPPGATIALVAAAGFAVVFAATRPRRHRHSPI
ncbi:MAG: metal ABC transporter permease [Acidimicrobiales bacterium]